VIITVNVLYVTRCSLAKFGRHGMVSPFWRG